MLMLAIHSREAIFFIFVNCNNLVTSVHILVTMVITVSALAAKKYIYGAGVFDQLVHVDRCEVKLCRDRLKNYYLFSSAGQASV